DHKRRLPGAGAEIERLRRRLRQRRQPGLEHRERVLGSPRVPLRSDRVELATCEPAEETPEPRICDDGVRRQARKAPAHGLPDVRQAHGTSTWIRTSCPSRAANISAALPPLIAIATFRYASS